MARAAIITAMAACIAAVGLWLSYSWSERYFLSELSQRGKDTLNLYAENMHGWLGRYRTLPNIYAGHPDVQALLRRPEDAARIAAVNALLVEWNKTTGAADTYLLDSNGAAIAASNWNDPVTFIGNIYDYRPYYQQAMQGLQGRFFALGTASDKRGYYFSSPVTPDRQIAGVMVVKVGVQEIESRLKTDRDEIFVSGPEGVIILAGNPDWRMTLLAPLDQAARARIAENRQFDLNRLAVIGDFGFDLRQRQGQLVVAGTDLGHVDDNEFLHLSRPLDIDGWLLHIFLSTQFARNQMVTTVLLVMSLLAGLGLIGMVLWQRRRRLVERLRERELAQATLEKSVAERTADLQISNQHLAQEVGERKQAEAELRRAQNELVQAGKLAALGQMSAALSHEFNQPLAAIRTYADNAGIFLDRGRETEARANMAQVVTLTERMAGLSKHLSSFARKPQDNVRPISLHLALNEALALLQGRLESSGAVLAIEMPEQDLWVSGGLIRLQQVIINLITNALDAMQRVDEPRLRIFATVSQSHAMLHVEDNGIGLPEDHQHLFDPFYTTKEVGQGLGLGLSISYNIIKDFGGNLEARPGSADGACFVLTLRRAAASTDNAPALFEAESPSIQEPRGRAAE